jgi:two-component system chemotaxis response regulator CheY
LYHISNTIYTIKGIEEMKKILIVDDSSMIRLIVSKAAKKAGYDVVEASNGQEGIDQLLKNNDISLILCDINMPVMDGLTMIGNIKEDESLKYIPVVMLTTESDEKLKQQGRELGVKAWMVKPFNETSFLKAMSKLIG